MAFQFKGFRATKPVVRLMDAVRCFYQAFFVVYDTDNRKYQMRYSEGINSLPVKERKREAQATAIVLWEALNNGWNPLLEKYPAFENNVKEFERMTLTEALDYSLKAKLPFLAKFSQYDYSGCVRFIKKAIKECGHLQTDVSKIQRRDIRMIIATAKEQHSWSSKARNKYLTIVKSLLSVLVDEDRIAFNPAHKIKNEPTESTLGYKRLTDDEKQKIADYVLLKDPAFFEYLMFIYQDGVRRKETLMIQVKHVNLARRQITITPEVAKMNAERVIPITNDLMEILMSREIWSLPEDWYIFSKNRFHPGPTMYHPNVPTLRWRRLVQEDLKIDCKMYSLKHKGADDKIEAGLDLDVLRTLYGHKSKLMTEVYARAVKGKYAEQIIDHAPQFAKVIPMKKVENG